MTCAWQYLIELLPLWMRDYVDKQGRDTLQELRLRINAPPMLIFEHGTVSMNRSVCEGDLAFCVNMVTKYSPWSTSTASKGYYAAAGGHRIGVCGTIILSNGQATGFQNLSSLCIRVARDFPGLAKDAVKTDGSVLILGPPGSGKTTMLRDYIRQLSTKGDKSITVIDERHEIFPRHGREFCFFPGDHTDVISGCGKSIGVEMALRNTGPAVIAVDEITAQEDCDALYRAGWCGVNLIATAHAASSQDLYRRPVYKPIVQSNLFDYLLIMRPDKSWHMERMTQ